MAALRLLVHVVVHVVVHEALLDIIAIYLE